MEPRSEQGSVIAAVTPKISIITPCYNAERYIGETVASVVEQRAVQHGRVDVEYIICDGGSTDRTVALARGIGGANVAIVSEQDRGMYHALAKGLERASGDIVAYLNAGDYYHPTAFDVVLDVLLQPDVQWLTGYAVTYNEASQVTGVNLPFRYRRDLLRGAAYDGVRLPFVQQESTFWRSGLTASVDLDRLASFKLAGDAYLWSCFAQRADLYVVEAHLGGFRRHAGQLSEDLAQYRAEMATFATRLTSAQAVRASVDARLWSAPPKVKKRLNPALLLRYDHSTRTWN